MPRSAEPSDHLGLIADKAIVDLGAIAARIEKVAFRMAPGVDRDELVWIVEGMRDEEARLRDRISALAKAAR